MITKIENPRDLPAGWFRYYQINDELEAAQIVNVGQTAYIFRSNILDCLYLFVEVK